MRSDPQCQCLRVWDNETLPVCWGVNETVRCQKQKTVDLQNNASFLRWASGIIKMSLWWSSGEPLFGSSILNPLSFGNGLYESRRAAWCCRTISVFSKFGGKYCIWDLYWCSRHLGKVLTAPRLRRFNELCKATERAKPMYWRKISWTHWNTMFQPFLFWRN